MSTDNDVDEAVTRIINDMLEARWLPGVSHLQYADEYDVKAPTIRRWAAEAGRFIRICRGNEEDIRDRHLATLDLIIHRAMQASKDKPEDRMMKAAQGAIELHARLCRLLEKKDETPTIETSAEELVEVLEGLGYTVTKPKESNGSSKKASKRAGKKKASRKK